VSEPVATPAPESKREKKEKKEKKPKADEPIAIAQVKAHNDEKLLH